jgi:general secretion pathway protein B
MSYILDALRKADAQRERDPARGIHAQPLRGTLANAGARSGRGAWFWGAAAAGIAALGSAGWYLYHDSGTAGPKVAARAEPPVRDPAAGVAAVPVPAPVVGTALVPPPAAPVPVVAVAIEPPAPPRAPTARTGMPAGGDPRSTSQPAMRGNQRVGAPGSAPVMTAQLPATPAPIPPGTASVPSPTGSPLPGAMPMNPPMSPGSAPVAGSPPGSVAAPGQVAPAVPAPPPPHPVPTPPPPPPPPAPVRAPPPPIPPAPPAQPVAGLPGDAPKLVISGGVYSTDRVQRMLIVNGQVFNEGSEIGTGVVLEEIKPKTAVLRFRGSRYTVSY